MNVWRVAGVVCNALVLGSLLFFALAKVISLMTGARVFQYQGF